MALHGVLLKKNSINRRKKIFVHFLDNNKNLIDRKKNLTFAELLTNFLLRKKKRVECVIW